MSYLTIKRMFVILGKSSATASFFIFASRSGSLMQNNKSLPDLAVKQGQIGGWELATLSFPCWHLAHIGCQLPDAILHGKRSCRPHSRAVQRLAVAEFRVRPLSSLGLAFADAGLRTRERHGCYSVIRVSTDWHRDG